MPMSNKINKAWHEKNKMPKNATLDQRIAWHIEHHKHCLCRDIPEKLKAEIIKILVPYLIKDPLKYPMENPKNYNTQL